MRRLAIIATVVFTLAVPAAAQAWPTFTEYSAAAPRPQTMDQMFNQPVWFAAAELQRQHVWIPGDRIAIWGAHPYNGGYSMNACYVSPPWPRIRIIMTWVANTGRPFDYSHWSFWPSNSGESC